MRDINELVREQAALANSLSIAIREVTAVADSLVASRDALADDVLRVVGEHHGGAKKLSEQEIVTNCAKAVAARMVSVGIDAFNTAIVKEMMSYGMEASAASLTLQAIDKGGCHMAVNTDGDDVLIDGTGRPLATFGEGTEFTDFINNLVANSISADKELIKAFQCLRMKVVASSSIMPSSITLN